MQGDIARSMKITRLYVARRTTLEYPEAMHPIRDAELFAVIFKINLSVKLNELFLFEVPPPTSANASQPSVYFAEYSGYLAGEIYFDVVRQLSPINCVA